MLSTIEQYIFVTEGFKTISENCRKEDYINKCLQHKIYGKSAGKLLKKQFSIFDPGMRILLQTDYGYYAVVNAGKIYSIYNNKRTEITLNEVFTKNEKLIDILLTFLAKNKTDNEEFNINDLHVAEQIKFNTHVDKCLRESSQYALGKRFI